jgi:riboflavin transporter FmnP
MGVNMRHTKKLTAIALLAAFAFLANYLSRFTPPIFPVPPLRWDAKDIVIVLGGYALGVVPAMAIAVVCSFFEVWIGTNGFLGMPMNIVSSWAFAVPAVAIFRIFYKKDRRFWTVALGLFIGTITVTITMVLWNWLLTPIIMGWPRARVVPLLFTVFLPFNLIKAGINSFAIFIVAPPLIKALQQANMFDYPKKARVADTPRQEEIEIE